MKMTTDDGKEYALRYEFEGLEQFDQRGAAMLSSFWRMLKYEVLKETDA